MSSANPILYPLKNNNKMGLKNIGSLLPPGFRFHPTDEELICHYLCKKVVNEEVDMGTLMEINLHSCEPWELPDEAKLNSSEWYFFSFRDRKYATGFRTNRATTTGYWKATGKDRWIWSPTTKAVVGMRKTLVFYQNRAPNGIKTGWIMHEFRLENPYTPPKEDWVLCRVFHKGNGENNNRLTPQNEFESSMSTFLVGSPSTDQTFTCKYEHQVNRSFSHSPPYQSQISNGTIQDSLLKSPSFRQLSTPRIDPTVMETNPANDYDYDFLFDMDFEESNVGDIGVPTNLEEIMEYGNDNSLTII